MARISTYALDNLDANDKLHGTDQNGNTKNFKIGPTVNDPGGENSATIVNYIEEASTRALAYKFHNANFGGLGSRQSGTISVTGTADQTDFSAVTTLKVSKFPYAASLQADPKSAANILAELVGERVKFSDIRNPNIYGIYNVLSFVQDGETNFFDMGLQHISSNGQFTAGNNDSTTPDIYLIEMFGTDLNFSHTQSSASATWNITHNLNKIPSVVIRTGSGVSHAAITHTDKNALTITFAEAQTGSAHLN